MEHPTGAIGRPGAERSDAGAARALCVDLDGTLLMTDLLWEAIIRLVRTKPWMLFVMPFWLLRGKAGFKRLIARAVRISADSLPYREDLLTYLRAERDAGRRIVLATASDAEMVGAVADHVGIFSEVLASDGTTNLSSHRKTKALVERFGAGGFDYAGNSSADLDVWQAAHGAIVVDAPDRVVRAATRSSKVIKIFSRADRVWPAVRSLRAYQWTKNLLVFIPLVMAHRVFEGDLLLRVIVAFTVLSLCASGTYVLNDLLDLPADRAHPIKRKRPIASGGLAIPDAIMLMAALLGAGLAGALLLPMRFRLIVLLYLLTTTAYSFYIKRLVVADILTLAGLYTLRILAGGVAAGVMLSFWLLAFSMFIFLSLAFMKRYMELILMSREGKTRSAGRGYVAEDLRIIETMGTISSFMSVAVLALFINSTEITKLYRRPELLWLVCPALLYWLIKFWFRAQRGSLENDDPIVAAFKDRASYVVAIIIGTLVILAT